MMGNRNTCSYCKDENVDIAFRVIVYYHKAQADTLLFCSFKCLDRWVNTEDLLE